MSTNSRMEQDKIETYARTLLEAAKAEGREKRDLHTLVDLANALGGSGTLRKQQFIDPQRQRALNYYLQKSLATLHNYSSYAFPICCPN